MNGYLLLLSFFLLGYIFPSSLIEEKKLYIQSTIESLEPLLKEHRNNDPLFFTKLDQIHSWQLLSEGDEGSYLLQNKENIPLFIAKPFDEAIYCLNNPKDYSSVTHPFLKKGIPLYRAAQTEALCYEIATLCSIENIYPKTRLALFPLPNKKLCSIQEYIPSTISLRAFITNLLSQGKEENELEPYLDLSDFGSIALLHWITYDNDAHASNILLYRKTDSLYGMKSIDHSLSLPEINEGFFSFIMYLPHAKKPISASIKQKILNIPIEEIQKLFLSYGLSSSYTAFEERVFVLQQLIKNPSITYYEVFIRLLLLKNQKALINASLQELEALLLLYI